ncbi:MAG: biotin--[acetyl-CoA-carboxylase] ligase [Erythrobacter sp.]
MIHIVEETGSTNADLVARLAADEAVPEGYWLVARQQTAGRGRHGRQWFDGTGNFMGSTLVRPAPGDPPPPTLALVSGLAAYETVLPLCPDPSAVMLKWPNDILLGGAKLAGILLEAVRGAVVIGIGVNLRAAPQLADRATTALADVGSPPALEDFAEQLAASFATELVRWRSHGLELLARRWQAAAHPLGTPLRVQDPGATALTGEFAGLDASGALLLRTADGKTQAVHAGDVTLD